MHKVIFYFFFLATFFIFFNSESHACGYWWGDPAGTWHGYSDYGCPYMRPPLPKKYQNLTGGGIFQSKGCTACHTIGGGDKIGPDLMGLFSRRTEKWVKKFISNPSSMIKSDAEAKKLKTQFTVEMPNPALTRQELSQIVVFLKEATK